MKRIICAAVFICMFLMVFSGCSNNNNAPIVGSWTKSYVGGSYSYNFTNDNQVLCSIIGAAKFSAKGTYTLKEDKVYINFDDEIPSYLGVLSNGEYTYDVNGGLLTLTSKYNIKTQLYKE